MLVKVSSIYLTHDFRRSNTKECQVTVNFDIDLDTFKRYLETKEKDFDDVMAIYDMICTQSDRLNEQGEPRTSVLSLILIQRLST